MEQDTSKRIMQFLVALWANADCVMEAIRDDNSILPKHYS
jgi:hypothetical protein